uniref:NADH dehydrogenase subunit 2 n=1 Tax=Blomia tropicalis TaxID=40697 RepID=UPI001FF5AF2C|nr:NADH dehydrogenase subunit 2 [Blomia tropicalis]UOG85313.1 NADH dehydrogenase subunit 2 [Blomia tropicalis]
MLWVLVLSTMLGMASSQWLMSWVMLEVNTLAMCGKVSQVTKKMKQKETQTFIYYLVQVFTSLIILTSSCMQTSTMTQMALISALMVKMGAWPTHIWYMKLIMLMKMGKPTLTILMTWQKILPLTLMSYPMMNSNMNKTLVMVITAMSIALPPLMMTPNMEMKTILGLSSVNNNGWLIMLLLCSKWVLLTFLALYTLSLSVVFKEFKNMKNKNLQNKKEQWTTTLAISNLSGLPPFTMFWAKVMALKTMMNSNIPTEYMMMMMLMACVLLYHYIYSTTNEMMTNQTKNQNPKKMEKFYTPTTTLMLSSTSMLACLYY